MAKSKTPGSSVGKDGVFTRRLDLKVVPNLILRQCQTITNCRRRRSPEVSGNRFTSPPPVIAKVGRENSQCIHLVLAHGRARA